MTTDNSTAINRASLDNDQLEQICSLAASIADICDDTLGGGETMTDAQLVALRSLAGNIGALADNLAGGTFRGGPLEWMRDSRA